MTVGVTMQDFVAVSQTLLGYGDLMVFKLAAVCHLGFLKLRNFNGR